MRLSLAILLLSAATTGMAQDKFLLKADGETDTYELIEQCGYYAETSLRQTADEFMGHGSYEHISQLWDDELDQYVFAFDIHVDFEEEDGSLVTDGNKATLVDRQRNEIKCMSSKPSTVAIDGETIHYRWKFMLPEGMLTTKEFCHIHQIKGMGDGAEVAHPVFTLTCRSTSNKQVLQVINVPFEGSANVNLAQLDLKPLLGKWIEADEYVTVGKHGSYRLTLTEVSTGKELLAIDEEDIEVWRDTEDNSTMRGKWGIYRSLGSELSLKEDLRSERLLFADVEAQKVIVDDKEENNTEIDGDAETDGDTEKDGDTEIGDTEIGDAEIGDAETDGDTEIDGDTETDGDTEIGDTEIGNTETDGDAETDGDTEIGDTEIGDTEIGDTETDGDTEIGDTETDGDTEIGDTEIGDTEIGDTETDGDTEIGDTEIEDGPEVDDAGVYSIFDSPNNDGAFYDLYGRKVLNPTRGLYIRNGEKIFVK